MDEYRHAFLRVDGVSTLLSVLSSGVNFQCQYQLVFCLWVLTFNGDIAEKMGKWVAAQLPFGVVPVGGWDDMSLLIAVGSRDLRAVSNR